VLHKSARLTSPNDFARTTKSGLRVTTQHFVGYIYLSTDVDTPSARLGLIIGKAFGGSVARHRLARQIRHTIAINSFPKNALIVIRALGLKGTAAHDINVEQEISELSEKLIKRSESWTVGARS
jgi:ribonuclease P protein component